ncbi:MAG TPA: FliH/SctL family protein [Pyrinomonadaceae bacterium]|nr:FliH/SctL family protein [Pyrinomonadaceae bacterium]
MSARLIKKSEHPGVIDFAPFLPHETNSQRQVGVVTPFVPKAKSTLASAAPAPARFGAAAAGEPHDVDPRLDDEAVFTARAERLIAEAQTRAAEIEREARERGLAEGRATAEAEIARLAEPLRQQLAQTIEETANLRAAIAERAERDLVKLAIEIAKKVVHRQVTMDSEVALTLARVALTRIHNRAQTKIYLHPDDFAYVTKHLDRLSRGSSIELVEDRAISRGGCLIETEMGDIDARIEQQFAELERSFLGV